MATIEQILGWRNLTGVINSIKSGIPNCLPDEFMKPGRSFSGNRGEYYRITGTRQVARIVQYGSPAQRRELRGLDLVPVTLMHSYESQQWPLSMTIALSSMTELVHNRMGEQQAEYQSKNFKKLFANLRIAASLYCMLQGKVYTTLDGKLAPSATATGVTTATTIDYQVPNSNTGNCSGIISVAWNQATAPIITQLLQIQTLAAKTTGYKLQHAFYDDTVPGYIGRNTEAQQYLKLQPAMANHYITTGTVPNGFGGIDYWHPAGSMFYDYAGTNIKIGAADGLVLTPGYDPEWFEIMEGSFPVPNNVLPIMGGDAVSALKQVTEVFGMFGYGQLTMNPPTVEQYAGDTFLPVLKVPGAVFQLSVV